MIKIKAGVTPSNLIIMAAVANVAELEGRTVVVTSGTDGRHMSGSRHYVNAALDIRSKDFESPEAKRAFLAAVLKRLGQNYQGLLEHEGLANEHFHIERERV